VVEPVIHALRQLCQPRICLFLDTVEHRPSLAAATWIPFTAQPSENKIGAMRPRIAVAALCLAAVTSADDGWKDTPALTRCWQATSSGDTDKLLDVFVQEGRDVAHLRSADGRGPLYWAYEFKMVDALALLMELESDEEAEDMEGKRPRHFFPDGQAELDGGAQPSRELGFECAISWLCASSPAPSGIAPHSAECPPLCFNRRIYVRCRCQGGGDYESAQRA
jgi:hypothetical protein